MDQSNEWQPGTLFQLHSETSLLSSSWQMGRGIEFNMANFQLFCTEEFHFLYCFKIPADKGRSALPSMAAN